MFDMGSFKVRGADKPKIEKFGTTLAQPELPAFPITPKPNGPQAA